MLRAMEKADHDNTMPTGCVLPEKNKLHNYICILNKKVAAKAVAANVKATPASMASFCEGQTQVPVDPVHPYVAGFQVTERVSYCDFYMAITSSTLVNFVPKGNICFY